MSRHMIVTNLTLLSKRFFTLTQKICIIRMSLVVMMPISFKTTLTTTQTIHITGQGALRTTSPEFGGTSLPLSHPQKTLTTATTSSGTAPLLCTTLQGDHHHHLILKSVILVYGLHIGLHIGLPTQHTTHASEDRPHVLHFLISAAPIQG